MIHLKRSFFVQPTLKVAKELLGKYLVRIDKGKRISGMIVETEAYLGPKDKASHAYLGKKTLRNRAEYLIGGHIYIYLVYGMYWQLNASTFKEGKPECVLIRALEPKEGIELMIKNSPPSLKATVDPPKAEKLTPTPKGRGSDLRRCGRSVGETKVINKNFGEKLTGGPGLICRSLNLDKSFYGHDLCHKKALLFVEDRGVKVKPSQIAKGPRIGIDYAGPYWSKKPWRFLIKTNKFVSKI
ncbi:DNA-3-methyladenine glycosylase [Candidatus Kuenenbacteria bacterium]|nr:DNA-3-methyladenine glycosylase [Candidatus Kuenenbacteria bacterium]OIP76532.1 MAG: hypothetical protein AUK09_01740 [Parcubacteria group bacterium CG2_30_36_38]